METGRETLKQQAYRIIKNKILYCEYAPNEVLNEELLLQDTGYSRAPIRDALGRLEQEHLLVIMPKKGIRISDVNMNDISSVFEMRCMVEPYAIRMYGNRLDKEKLREYKKKFETDITPEKVMDAAKEKRLIEMFTLDDEFHQYIVRNRSAFRSCLNQALILFFAWLLFTRFNQSRLGPFEFWEVMTSIRSPFWIT